MIPVADSEKMITEADILDALDQLNYARAGGDKLRIALFEASLNDLIDRYSYHSCHRSQTETVT
jgi:hypothetical protein